MLLDSITSLVSTSDGPLINPIAFWNRPTEVLRVGGCVVTSLQDGSMWLSF